MKLTIRTIDGRDFTADNFSDQDIADLVDAWEWQAQHVTIDLDGVICRIASEHIISIETEDDDD